MQRGAQVILPLFKNNNNNKKAAKQISRCGAGKLLGVLVGGQESSILTSFIFSVKKGHQLRIWRKEGVLEVCKERRLCKLIVLIGCGQCGSPKGSLEIHGQVKI